MIIISHHSAGVDPRVQPIITYANPPEFEYAEFEQRLKTAGEAWRHETDDPALDPAFHDQVEQKFSNR